MGTLVRALWRAVAPGLKTLRLLRAHPWDLWSCPCGARLVPGLKHNPLAFGLKPNPLSTACPFGKKPKGHYQNQNQAIISSLGGSHTQKNTHLLACPIHKVHLQSFKRLSPLDKRFIRVRSALVEYLLVDPIFSRFNVFSTNARCTHFGRALGTYVSNHAHKSAKQGYAQKHKICTHTHTRTHTHKPCSLRKDRRPD